LFVNVLSAIYNKPVFKMEADVELTPEERRRIYEEEKSRLEQEEQAKKSAQREGGGTTGLEPNIAAFLTYLGTWITGIIFLVLEQKNKFVRFHAAQSIIVFGTLGILSALLGAVPFAGRFFSAAVGVLIFILWLVLMVKAYRNEFYRLPVAAELADWLLNTIGQTKTNTMQARSGTEQIVTISNKNEVVSSRTGEIVGSALAIAFNLAASIFLNVYNEYFAYYYESGGIWVRVPLFTSEFNAWLPIVNTAIALTIAGHIVLIIIGNRIVRETVLVMVDIFALITIGALLSIFPFNFTPLPISAELTAWGVRTGLGIAMVVIVITVIVRFVKLVVRIVRTGQLP